MMRLCDRLIVANGGQRIRIAGQDGYRMRKGLPEWRSMAGGASANRGI